MTRLFGAISPELWSQTKLSQFFDWWWGEIRELIPDQIWLRLVKPKRSLLITRSGSEQLLVEVLEGDHLRELGHFEIRGSLAAVESQLNQEGQQLAELPTVLIIEDSQILTLRTTLPKKAAENLYAIVGFEMDRLTPFNRSQVSYMARVVKQDPANASLLVEISLIPRSNLDAILDEFLVYGWKPNHLQTQTTKRSKPLDLIPESYKTPPQKEVLYTQYALITSLILLCILISFMPLLWWESEAESYESQMSRMTKEIREVGQIREEISALEKEAHFLEIKKQKIPSLTHAFEELSKILPDNAWLNGLQFRDNRLIIQGQSASASLLIEKLEHSSFFQNVSFISPVTKDPSSGTERFQISADVVNERLPEKTQ